MKSAWIALAGLVLSSGGMACGPKPTPRPVVRRPAERPAKRRVPPRVRIAYQSDSEGECDEGESIVRVTMLPGKGVTGRKRIGCGRVGLEGGLVMDEELQDGIQVFAVLVKPVAPPRPRPGEEELLSQRQKSFDYEFWGPAGKPFHKVENTAQLQDIVIVAQRWLSYQFAMHGAPARGFSIVDAQTGKVEDDSGRLVSELFVRKRQVVFVLIPETTPGGKGKKSDFDLWCVDLPSMKSHHLVGLPKFKGDWDAVVKWTSAGKIAVDGLEDGTGKRFRRSLTCPGVGSR